MISAPAGMIMSGSSPAAPSGASRSRRAALDRPGKARRVAGRDAGSAPGADDDWAVALALPLRHRGGQRHEQHRSRPEKTLLDMGIGLCQSVALREHVAKSLEGAWHGAVGEMVHNLPCAVVRGAARSVEV